MRSPLTALEIPDSFGQNEALGSTRYGIQNQYELLNGSPDAPGHFIESLLRRNQDLAVTTTILKIAKQPNNMQALLERTPNLRVTAETLEAAASTFAQALKLVPMLLAHDKSATVPQALLSNGKFQASADTVEYLALLLERSPDLDIPAELVLDVITSVHDLNKICLARPEEPALFEQRLAELLLKYNKRIAFTDTLRRAIELWLDGMPSVKALFYQLEVGDGALTGPEDQTS